MGRSTDGGPEALGANLFTWITGDLALLPAEGFRDWGLAELDESAA